MPINNVVIVCDHAYINGGAAKVAVAEAIALAQKEVKVVFFSGVGPADVRLSDAGVIVICLAQKELKNHLKSLGGKIIGATQGFRNKKAMHEFDRILNQFSPEDTIIHFHSWSLSLSQALFSITAKRCFKIALTCHDYEVCCPVKIFYNYKKHSLCQLDALSMKCLCTNCDKRSYFQKIYRSLRHFSLTRILKKNDLSLICLTDMEEKIINAHLKINCDKYIVHNPVDIRSYIDIKPSKNSKFIFIGRIVSEKGVDMFCEAVSRAGVEAEVIGSGEESANLHEKYPNVKFHGWLSPDQMIPYIKKARCLIVTSYWIETGPLNVLEVQCSYAMPCIVPSMCGVAESVLSRRTGLVYEIGNINELEKCIEQCKDDGLIEELSNNCKKIDKNQYTVLTHLDALIKTYESILSK